METRLIGSRQHGHQRMQEVKAQAQSAVTWARDHVFERSAVQDGRAILETALARSMGETTHTSIRQEFQRRIDTGEFQEISDVRAGKQYTTRTMVGMEREIMNRIMEGNQRYYSDPMLVSPPIRIATEDRHPELNPSQLQAVDEIFLSREKIVALDGVAGAGKTLAFLIPVVETLSQEPARHTVALVLLPTRELAMQVHEQYEQLRTKGMPKAALIIGGVSEKAQIQNLRAGSRLVIATPGRLQDLVNRNFAD